MRNSRFPDHSRDLAPVARCPLVMLENVLLAGSDGAVASFVLFDSSQSLE